MPTESTLEDLGNPCRLAQRRPAGGRHLLERGFTHFGYCGYEGRIWSRRRQEVFCERSEGTCLATSTSRHDAGALVVAPRTVAGHRLVAVARQAGGNHGLQRFAGRQVIESCLQAGFRVPDDVAVVGVDEDRLQCDLAYPPLSSVAFNLERAGLSGGRAARWIDVGPDQATAPHFGRADVGDSSALDRRRGHRRPPRGGGGAIHPRSLSPGHCGRRSGGRGGHFTAQLEIRFARHWDDRCARRFSGRGWLGASDCWRKPTSRPRKSPNSRASAV